MSTQQRTDTDAATPARSSAAGGASGAGAGAGAGASATPTRPSTAGYGSANPLLAAAAVPGSAAASFLNKFTPEEEERHKKFVAKRKGGEPLYYSDYLQLDKILNAQRLESRKVTARGAHDEHLFIVIHQVYELWFKQILHEIDSVIEIFSAEKVPEQLVAVAVSRLERVTEIQRILLDQIKVLETMSPLDFLDFRDYLFPASGFQSKQFRLLENRLGLKEQSRILFGKARYCSYLSKTDRAAVLSAQKQQSLYDVVEKWLERTPFMRIGNFDTWNHYKEAVDAMLTGDEEGVRNTSEFTEEAREELLKGIAGQRRHFQTLVDETKYQEFRERGEWRLSHKATIAALLISLYKEEPVFHVPARLLSLLVDIDEFLTAWRYRHALMVHRMLGVKIGTGGSSGYHYLRATAQSHKIFSDFANLATFLIPRHALPRLPANVAQLLGFAAAGADGAADATVVSPLPRAAGTSTSAKRELNGAPEAVEARPAKRARNGATSTDDGASPDAAAGDAAGNSASAPRVCPHTGAVAE